MSWGIDRRPLSNIKGALNKDAKRSRSSAVNANESCFPRARGETNLVYRNGAFYLLAVCDVDEPTPQEVDGVLAGDLGVTNIAVDSDATMHSGAQIKHVRYRHRRLRRRTPRRKTTRAARLRLRRVERTRGNQMQTVQPC